MKALPAADLDHVLERTPWGEFRGARLFVTGGTGFFGRWLLETFADANRRLGLGMSAVVLTRDPAAFAVKAPRLAADPALGFVAGDVRTFDFPAGQFPFVVHAATDADARRNTEQPLAMFDVTVRGTGRVLEFARGAGCRRFLLTSSGAVYGRQPADVTHLPEEYPGGPDPCDPDPRNVYAQAKRAAETQAVVAAAAGGFAALVARCWAFVGPHLPLDAHFAAGNFLRDALAGGPVRVGGDGTPYRSYLYAADLAVWLWTVLARGASARPYNVGSDEAVTIAELARAAAAAVSPPAGVVVANPPTPGRPAERYVPAVGRARRELGLEVWVPLADALARTAAFAGGRSTTTGPGRP